MRLSLVLVSPAKAGFFYFDVKAGTASQPYNYVKAGSLSLITTHSNSIKGTRLSHLVTTMLVVVVAMAFDKQASQVLVQAILVLEGGEPPSEW